MLFQNYGPCQLARSAGPMLRWSGCREIFGTMAGCLVGMSAFRIAGYAMNGLDYSPYFPVIAACAFVSVGGSWVGKRLADSISERLFRAVYRVLITLTALRLIWVGLLR